MLFLVMRIELMNFSYYILDTMKNIDLLIDKTPLRIGGRGGILSINFHLSLIITDLFHHLSHKHADQKYCNLFYGSTEELRDIE